IELQLDGLAVQDVALREQLLIRALVVQVSLDFLAAQNVLKALQTLVSQNADFVAEVLLQLLNLLLLDRLGALVLLLALAGEDADVNDRTFNTRRSGERSVTNIAGLLG